MKAPINFSLRLLLATVVTIVVAGCQSPTPRTHETSVVTGPAAVVAPKNEEADRVLAKVIQIPPSPLPGEGWIPMFDDRTLAGWRATDFIGKGGVSLRDGVMVLNRGGDLTGVNFTNESPQMDYEIALEAVRLEGQDFFCGLTFPVRTNSCTLVLGGWGGSLVGISSLDGRDASENETTRTYDFANGRWYRIRVRVTPKLIEAWLDDERVINAEIFDRAIGMRAGEIELAMPLGISSYATCSGIRNVHYRRLN